MLQDVQAYRAVRVYVRVEHFGEELDFRRFIGVLLGKFYGQVETAPVPDCVFGAENHGLPVEQRVAAWRRLDALLRCVFMHLLQVLEQASFCV